ncbi:hypothetical protein ARTHRO8AJ_370021 [Arthrobacter sp. 8AJ]|nr:hypothetical protein ARTHRO8AJ_370021 [Arthrobacter sp. 8AJ]
MYGRPPQALLKEAKQSGRLEAAEQAEQDIEALSTSGPHGARA